MFEIAAIDHIVLRTDKLQLMLEFYVDALGCKIERETPAHIGLTQLRAGSALIDLVNVDSRLGRMGGGAPTITGKNVDHFCLQLKPISDEEIRTHLQSHDIEAGEFGERYGAQGLGRSVYIRDPEGNTVELRSQIQAPYCTFARGLDPLNATYQMLDLVPKGRDEAQLSYVMEWVRLHDEY